MRDLWFRHGHIDITDLERSWATPFVALQGLQSSRHSFVQAIRSHVNGMRGALEIVETNAAVPLTHRESLPHCIRLIFAKPTAIAGLENGLIHFVDPIIH
jgi:hypothetical protein